LFCGSGLRAGTAFSQSALTTLTLAARIGDGRRRLPAVDRAPASCSCSLAGLGAAMAESPRRWSFHLRGTIHAMTLLGTWQERTALSGPREERGQARLLGATNAFRFVPDLSRVPSSQIFPAGGCRPRTFWVGTQVERRAAGPTR
jgi:hypothetical protein